MRSFMARHWSGALGTWLSLLATCAVYLAATLAVVTVGRAVNGPLATVLLIGAWAIPVLAAVIGTLRSALHALREGRNRPVNALGGVVAILVLGLALYGAAQDLRGLLFGA